jgi:hypothetical protein
VRHPAELPDGLLERALATLRRTTAGPCKHAVMYFGTEDFDWAAADKWRPFTRDSLVTPAQPSVPRHFAASYRQALRVATAQLDARVVWEAAARASQLLLTDGDAEETHVSAGG